jgi:hypothetical protein
MLSAQEELLGDHWIVTVSSDEQPNTTTKWSKQRLVLTKICRKKKKNNSKK